MRRVLATALLLGACGAPPAPTQASLWTLPTLKDSAKARDWPLTERLFVPAGAPIPFLSDPYSSGQTAQAGNIDGLSIYPAFSEGLVAAYTITEIWNHFPAVWLQPLYLPVTDFNANGAVFDPNARPIFSIDTSSRFYSPYWQILYFIEPPGTSGTWTSAKQVLDSGLTLIEGRGTYCTLGPASLEPAHAAGAQPVRPLSGEPVGVVNNKPGWVDGKPVSYIDFGVNRFQWDPVTNVIRQAALFQFAVRDSSGNRLALDLPKVGGTGPLGAPNSCSGDAALSGHLDCPNTPNNKPQFGALWHEYTALLPATAGVFVPSSRPALRAHVASTMPGIRSPKPSAALEALDLNDQYTLRVAFDAACFQGTKLSDCLWLDSQAALENNLPQYAFEDQDRLSSCPMLLFNGYLTP